MLKDNFIIKINTEKVKENFKKKFSNFNIENIFDALEFNFLEYSFKDFKLILKVDIKKKIESDFLNELKKHIEEQSRIKVIFVFNFLCDIDLTFLIKNYWDFFLDFLGDISAWFENTTTQVIDDKLIIYCHNNYVYKKIQEDEIKSQFQKFLNRFFSKDIKYEVKLDEKFIKRDLNSIKIEESSKHKIIESQILTSLEIKGKAISISDIGKEGKYVIEGDIFFSENFLREYKADKFILLFYLTDYYNSIKLKAFVDKHDGLIYALPDLKTVKALVEVKYDEKEEGLVGTVLKMQEISKNEILDNAEEKRIEFHAHTNMSAMDSVININNYIKTAKKWGHKAIAITDHGVVHAFPEAYKIAKKHGIKIIFGMEGYLVQNKESYRKDNYSHIILIVKNKIGLKNLYKLVSKSHIDYFYKKPRLPKEIISEYRDGLLLGTACYLGELYQAILSKKDEKEIENIVKFYDFLEIQPVANNRFLIREKKLNSDDDIKNINRQIFELGEKFSKPVIATGDIHFLKPEDKVFRQVLMAGQGYEDLEADASAELYFRPTDEMLAEFSYLGKKEAYEVVILNPEKLNNLIDSDIKPIPDELYAPELENANEEIVKLTEERAKSLYGVKMNDIVRNRIKTELESIIKNKFSSLYIIAKRMVEKSMEKGYIVGSRGSVGSSFVAFLCGISEVNPLPAHYLCSSCKYIEFVNTDVVGIDLEDKKCPQCGQKLGKDGFNIPFETFVGFKRNKPPDIDLNFAGEIQDYIHKFVIDMFGSDRVYRVGTIVTIKEQAVKKDFINKFLEKTGKKVNNAEIERLAMGCSGVKRSTGQHAGGLILIPESKEIYDFTPIQFSPEKDIITTHFDYQWLEKSIVKIDALGHDLPTSLNRLCKDINIKIEDIPLDDKKVLQIFRDIKVLKVNPDNYEYPVGTLGIPEYGTRFVRKILSVAKPKNFSELIYIAGLSHGKNVWENNAEELLKSKKVTLSDVISVRDDIMNYLIKKGVQSEKAYEITERVRKKDTTIQKEDEEIMRKHKIPEWYIESCKKITYMFPKAHASAYAIMSVRIAFFKVYHPLYFYADYFTRQLDVFKYEFAFLDISKIKSQIRDLKIKKQRNPKEEKQLEILEVIFEMKERGFEFLNVDLYESSTSVFKVMNNKIILPLRVVPELGEKAARIFEEERKKSRFSSLEDLVKRTHINKNVSQFFKENNILNDIPETEQIALF
ncbi:MAG: PolC-type DNA polymerase III [Candidatus Goldbacteria bacterium]|nr:PolC-type DNA polymerase III [Candidatus Goldiibacteriota bacterium]